MFCSKLVRAVRLFVFGERCSLPALHLWCLYPTCPPPGIGLDNLMRVGQWLMAAGVAGGGGELPVGGRDPKRPPIEFLRCQARLCAAWPPRTFVFHPYWLRYLGPQGRGSRPEGPDKSHRPLRRVYGGEGPGGCFPSCFCEFVTAVPYIFNMCANVSGFFIHQPLPRASVGHNRTGPWDLGQGQ